MNLFILVILALLTLLVAMFSAAEAALFSLGPSDRETLAKGPSRKAKALRLLLESPRQFIFTLQVAGEVGLVGVTMSIAAWIIAEYSVQHGWLTFALAPPYLLIFCLLLPRSIATRYPGRTVAMLAVPIQISVFVLRPLMWPLEHLSQWLMKLMGIPVHGAYRLEESEFKTLVDIGREEGTLGEQERELRQ